MLRKRSGSIFCVLVLLGSSVATAASGAPTFSVRRNTVLDARPVWPGDFNGDGITDLAGSTRPDPHGPPIVTVLLGRGDGTFGAPIRSAVMGDVYAVGDANDDGRQDLLVQQFPQPDEDVLVLGGRGDGTFDAGHRVTTAYQSNFGLLVDLDGDGHRDVVVGQITEDSGGDIVAVYRGHGDFTFDFPPVTLPSGFVPYAGIAADLNRDGRRDLVVSNLEDNFISVYLNDGGLRFTTQTIPKGAFVENAGVTVGDLNGDDTPDLAYTQTSGDGFPYGVGAVLVAFGAGDGTFGTPTRYGVTRGAWKVIIADVTRDGVPDIITANRSSAYIDDCGGNTLKTWDSLSVLTGVGDGTFHGPDNFSIGNQLSVDSDRDRNTVSSLLISDVNGDGSTDLITSGGTIFVNHPSDPNWAPRVDLGPDQTYQGGSFGAILKAMATDVDQDVLTYAWTSDTPESLPPIPRPCLGTLGYGTFHFTVTADDGHGHQASDTIAVTFVNPQQNESAVTIQAPAANDTIPAGQPYTLRWHVHNPIGSLFTVNAYVSLVGGHTYGIAGSCENLPTDLTIEQDMSCTWTPGEPTSNGRILIKGFDDDNLYVTGSVVGPVTIAAASALPAPWQDQDVGAVGAPGSASYRNGVYTITASGADIWGTADEFHYVFRPTPTVETADVELITHVDSVQNVNPWTKAGLMIRTSMAADAMHAFLFVSPGKGIAFQRRASNGAISVHTGGPAWTAPVWLRLTVRTGCAATCPETVVRAYYRKYATDPWTFLGEQQYIGGSYQFNYVGLAVTSHQDGTTATATFSAVTLRDRLSFSTAAIGTTDATANLADDDSWTLSASGADMWGTSDQFLYAYTQAASSAITTRVKSLTNTNAWSKAGVMYRASTSGNSAYVMVIVSPGKGVAMQYRAATGGTSTQVAQVTGITAPVWVRLTHAGTSYTGSYSTDGATWNTLGSVTIAGLNGQTAGAALTSHTTSARATAVMEGLYLEP
jgi:hypothetical protein